MRIPGPARSASNSVGVLLILLLTVLLTAQIFDPALQLFDRDAGRAEYSFKQFMALRLRAGELPLWFPWTAAGTSMLGEMTPALFHPATLLYLFLPFELAFKLNHVLPLPLAGLGALLLARKLGAASWQAALAGVVYAGSGYLASMSASNVHYALGAAALPLAVHGLLRFLERPSALRLLWAGFALALPLLGGEPQSALLAGYGGVVAAVSLHGLRSLRLVALWGAAGLLLCGPSLLPGLAQLRRSARHEGISAFERQTFRATPVRLLGLALPWAFDDAPERTFPDGPLPAFREYFAGPTGSAFVTSFALSLPALLLAAFARGRKALLLGLLALFFAIGSLGTGLENALPGLSLFRFPEKLLGPLTLLLALLAGLGAEEAFDTPRTAGRLALASFGAAALLLAVRMLLLLRAEPFVNALQEHGTTHSAGAAQALLASLAASCLAQACFAAALGFIAGARWLRPLPLAPLLAAVLCTGAAVLASRDLFFLGPLELLHGPFVIADELRAKAGPSPGRWRIDSDPDKAMEVPELDRRTGYAVWTSQVLAPQFNALAQVESVALYASLTDADYLDAWHASPGAMTSLFGVRFLMRSPWALTDAEARDNSFVRTAFGFWVREVPPQPRAFLVGCARDLPKPQQLLRLASPEFDPHREALGAALPRCVPGPAGTVALQRSSPERLEAKVTAAREALLVFADHYDPGWRATVDGKSAKVIEADLTALAVELPPGSHEVQLHFWPLGLTAGLCSALATILGLLAFEIFSRGRPGLRERRGVPNVGG
ncbi:MAG TPA: YfhO family protein [Myxococcales bacterium]|nr:YfhO family protein [Myxococcales bacterium]